MDIIVIGLYVVGFLLILLEVFLPGGVFALAGAFCLLAGIYFQEDDLTTALWKMALVVLALTVIVPLVVKAGGRAKAFQIFTRQEALTDDAGFQSRSPDLDKYLGLQAMALTDLRPSGTVELADGKRLDVTTRGDYIEKGNQVEIIALDGTWLFVKKV